AAGLDLPRADRVERRRAKRLAGAKTETGVMPWASDGVVHNQPLGKRGAIVGARSRYCEECLAAPSHQYGLALGVAQQHAPVPELRDGDPPREVRSTQFLFFRHLFRSSGAKELFNGWRLWSSVYCESARWRRLGEPVLFRARIMPRTSNIL